jgi:hypothetical protein
LASWRDKKDRIREISRKGAKDAKLENLEKNFSLRAWRLGAIKKIGQTDSRKGAKSAKGNSE